MWTIRFLLALLVVLPYFVPKLVLLLLAAVFIPPLAAGVSVAHSAADHEDESADFVSPVFWAAARESLWVYTLFLLVVSHVEGTFVDEAVAITLLCYVPAAVLTLVGCYIGVLFARENLTRQVSAFGAASFTSVVIVADVALAYYFYDGAREKLPPLLALLLLVTLGLSRTAAAYVSDRRAGALAPLIVTTVLVLLWFVGLGQLLPESI